MNGLADLSDEELLATYVDEASERARRQQAFGELVDRYERRVYAIAYRELGSHADAEEATQDTFLHLARRGGQFRGDSKLSTFVYRIAVNACRDLARRRARRPQTPVQDVTEAQIGAGMTPDAAPDDLTARETALQVQAALEQLDDLSRTLVILCSIEGYSYPEAAEILDLPVGTIKSRVFRARAKLAELLAAPTEDSAPVDGGRVDGPAPSHGVPSTQQPRGPPSG